MSILQGKMININDDLGEEKRKRGRPKKVTIEAKSPQENDLGLKRKRGRRKKPETTAFIPQFTVANIRNESNYIVMLDIKYSDLHSDQAPQNFEGANTPWQINSPWQGGPGSTKLNDTCTQYSGLNTSVNRPKVGENCDRLLCDSLINAFSRLIAEKRRLYENCPTLKTIHSKLITPEKSPVNFYSNYEQQQINTKVLPIFELNGNNWPNSSNYVCWNCDCQFDTPPVGIPEKIKDNQFYCSGNFCSFPCAARFIVDSDKTVNRLEKISLLNTLYQKAFNLDLNAYVTIANPRQTLHKYGGCLSYSQYHSEKAKEVSLYKLPMVPLFYYLCHENTSTGETNSEYTREVVN